MGGVVDIEENKPHRVFEALCAKCLSRYTCVCPTSCMLKDLECEKCGTGYIINTGQEIE